MFKRLTNLGQINKDKSNDSASTAYRTKFFSVGFGNTLSFQTLHGKSLIEKVELSYTTCQLYNIREPLIESRRIVLDHLTDLQVGDEILVTNNMYGYSVVPTYQFLCCVKELRLSSIILDRELPAHFMRYSNGLIVLRRSQHMYADCVDEVNLRKIDGGAVVSWLLRAQHFVMDCALQVQDDSSRVEVTTKTTFLESCRLFNLSFALHSQVPITELFLKNRICEKLSKNRLKNDVWLWKEGCRAEDDQHSWILLHNPQVASTEIVTDGAGFALKTISPTKVPTAVINLEHYNAQHYRRHKEKIAGDYSFSSFEDLSLPAFEQGTVKEHAFGFYLGENLLPPPRFMLAPYGFRAVNIWTEHADKTSLDTQRAAYFGHQDISSGDEATGGFVLHNHVVTKSIFYDNPDGYQNEIYLEGKIYSAGEMLSFKKSEAFREMLTQLKQLGHEICIHALTPNDSISISKVIKGISEISTSFGSSTWIDHGMQNVKSSLGWQGLLNYSGHYVGFALAESGIRYIWSWASTDFMSKDKSTINLLHNWKAEYMPTPLYWRHPALLNDMVVWASNEAPLDAFSEQAVDQLIQDRGVSINQHYYPFLVDDCYDFGFIERDSEGKYATTERFDNVLSMMARKRDAGELLITTVGKIVKYWLDLESIQVDLSDQGFSFVNCGDSLVLGMSFVVRAKSVHTTDVEFSSRPIDSGDLLVWFDIAARHKVIFEIGE